MDGTRSALITGSSSGFGRAVAERFASRGWRVFASMRDPARGEALRGLAAAKGWHLTTPALDVTDGPSVEGAVGEVLRQTAGRLDVLVNNAGYYAYGPLEETTSDELRAQLETNVIGVHRVTRAVLPAMRARGQGAVVTIGSVSGRVALPIVGPYHASKWALEGM
ncbi:MAG: SDR family NAD(P)-dependent oxidoreductase, partial [Pseudomonadota bacterium]